MNPYPPGQWNVDPVSRLSVTVYGIDGTNGLVGTVKSHSSRLAAIESRWDRMVFLAKAGRWTLMALLFLGVLTGTDDFGRKIGAALDAAIKVYGASK